MALRINTNVAAMSTAHIMGDNNGDLGTRLERISSGKRINTAADDVDCWALIWRALSWQRNGVGLTPLNIWHPLA